MSRRNSLMEWLDQTKKLSKLVDYMALDLIDSVISVLKVIDKKTIRKHKAFFDYYCNLYHKPNPVKLITDNGNDCKIVRKALCDFLTKSIMRTERQRDSIVWQWFEVIDFMYERPELVDPSVIQDSYVKQQIDSVCDLHRKNNPFKNGILSRLGKFWKDSKGRWRIERRERF